MVSIYVCYTWWYQQLFGQSTIYKRHKSYEEHCCLIDRIINNKDILSIPVHAKLFNKLDFDIGKQDENQHQLKSEWMKQKGNTDILSSFSHNIFWKLDS